MIHYLNKYLECSYENNVNFVSNLKKYNYYYIPCSSRSFQKQASRLINKTHNYELIDNLLFYADSNNILIALNYVSTIYIYFTKRPNKIKNTFLVLLPGHFY